jgi:hypothetical protein
MGVKLKIKKCKFCKLDFMPTRPLQYVCSNVCASHYAALKSKEKAKKEKKEAKEKMKTRTDHLKELQVIFNKYIRLRDKDKPCISCDRPLPSKYDASHFFSVGSYPNLRFNENNCHAACIFCNQHKHGNILEYSLRLPKRIGEYEYNGLIAEKDKPLKLTLPEILELKEVYKAKIKGMG